MEEPDRSPKVMKILEVLAKAERDQRVMANVNERLRDVGFVELRSPGDGEVWQLSAQGVDQDGTCLGKVQLRRRSEDQTRSLSAPTASIQVTDAGLSASRGMEQWLGRADASETGIRLHLPQAKVGQEPEVREVFLNDLQLTSVDLQAPVLTWQAIQNRLDAIDASTRRLLERVVDRTFRESISNRWFRVAMPATLPGSRCWARPWRCECGGVRCCWCGLWPTCPRCFPCFWSWREPTLFALVLTMGFGSWWRDQPYR